MKRERIIILILCVLVTVNLNAQSIKKISKAIRKCQIMNVYQRDSILTSYFITSYYKLRIKTDFIRKLKNDSEFDTIYILEKHSDGQDLDLAISIWNRKKMISYDLYQKNIRKRENVFFTKYQIKLTNEWNVNKIRNEELKNSVLPKDKIYATRIVLIKKKFKIDCFAFSDFFNLERDYQGSPGQYR